MRHPVASMVMAGLVALVLASCGNGASANCTPAGTEIHEAVIVSHTYEHDCLAAPADTSFTIVFRSEDPPNHPHDVVVTDGDQVLVDSKSVSDGASTTVQGGPLAAGTYAFHCSTHSFMIGTFIVK
jgi:plastocyanin